MARRYRYEVSQKHTSLGQIERALGLLGFRMIEVTIDDDADGLDGPPSFHVIFEQGRTMDHKVKSDAVIDQVQGVIPGVTDAKA